MKISILASGSKGNCTYLETNSTKSLIDIGMTCLYIENNLRDLKINPSDIQNIFLTHTHIDHIAGLKVFLKKYKPTVYLTHKMYEEIPIELKDFVLIDDSFTLNDLEVTSFKTSHDIDSVGYVFKNLDKEMVYVTDTGYINKKYHNLLKGKDFYVIESNHDVKLLMNNEEYPYPIRQRILSDKGHLSNKDSAYYISKFFSKKTKCVVLAHISQNNNTKDLAIESFCNKLDKKVNIIVAEQNKKTELIEI